MVLLHQGFLFHRHLFQPASFWVPAKAMKQQEAESRGMTNVHFQSGLFRYIINCSTAAEPM